MKGYTVAALLAAAALIALASVTAWSQADMMVVDNSFFEDPERPPATFEHDIHNMDAGVMDCAVCHHMYENGELVEGMDSVGMYCSDCHGLESVGSQPGLMEAYHGQCKGCHMEEDAGPVTCGGCHEKGNEKYL
jgi:hypothetical protein